MVMNISKRSERKEDGKKIVYRHFKGINRASVICTNPCAPTRTDIFLFFPVFKTRSQSEPDLRGSSDNLK